MRAPILAIASLALLPFAAGCTSLSETQAAKGSGVKREFPAPQEAVWNSTVDVLSDLSMVVVSGNRDEKCILAEHGSSTWSRGEKIAIFVEPAAEGVTRVEVISKRSWGLNAFAKDWSRDILDRLGKKLAPAR